MKVFVNILLISIFLFLGIHYMLSNNPSHCDSIKNLNISKIEYSHINMIKSGIRITQDYCSFIEKK